MKTITWRTYLWSWTTDGEHQNFLHGFPQKFLQRFSAVFKDFVRKLSKRVPSENLPWISSEITTKKFFQINFQKSIQIFLQKFIQIYGYKIFQGFFQKSFRDNKENSRGILFKNLPWVDLERAPELPSEILLKILWKIPPWMLLENLENFRTKLW